MWKQIPSEPNYEASAQGQVRRLGAKAPRKIAIDRHGYATVDCWTNGHKRNRFVHQLVLEAHTSPCPPGHETDHIDHDPLNNRLENLRWLLADTNNTSRKNRIPITAAVAASVRHDFFYYGIVDLAVAHNMAAKTARRIIKRQGRYARI